MEPDSAKRSPTCSNYMAEAVTRFIQHQDLVSVNQLPPEILMCVLEEAAPSTWYRRGYYKSLFRIRRVCKYWRDIVDSTPSLWTSIWLEFNLNLIEMILVKSKAQRLSIWYDDHAFSGYEPLPEDQVSAFLDLVTPSAGRWKFLDYRASSDAQHPRLLGLPFDELRQLNILLSGNITYTSTLNTPKLAYLDVHRCSLNWFSISGLRSLTIDQNTEGPDLDELIAVLRASPDLEQLKVERNWPMSAPPQSHILPTLPPILLPKLRAMIFSKLPVIPLSILLDQIEAPNLRCFSHAMTYKYMSDDFPRIFGSAGRHIGDHTLPRADENRSKLAILADSETLRMEVGDRDITLRRFGWTEANGRLERLASVSAALARFHPNLCSAVKVVSFENTPWSAEVVEHLRLIHTRFPYVKELILMGPEGDDPDVDSIVEELGSARDLTSGREVLFPCLVSLRLRARRSDVMLRGSSILKLVISRAESTKAAALKTIALEGCRIAPEIAEKLKQALRDLQLSRTEINSADSDESS